MRKRIENYILSEPWEERMDKLMRSIDRNICRPMLLFAAGYFLYRCLMVFGR